MFPSTLLGLLLAFVGCLGLIFDKKVWQFKIRSGHFWGWFLLALAGCVLFLIAQP